MHQQQVSTECLDWGSGYLEYLRDARRGIELCAWACRDWSAPYDGENPSPITAPPPPPPPTANPSLTVFPEHFSFSQQGANSSTPPGQQRAAVVAAARSEWSSSERDSGEWDVTIGKNNCISLTPRSKKRSLQREEVLPKPVPPLLPPSSASSSLQAPHPSSSSAPHLPASDITIIHQAMFNGTAAQGEGCSESRDAGMEVKKVKRDLGDQRHLAGDSNQNGSIVVLRPPPQPTYNEDNGDISDDKPLPLKQIPSPRSHPLPTSDANLPTGDGSNPCNDPPPSLPEVVLADQGPQSVERLIEELLEQAPGDPQPPGDSNSQGISIEAFTQELRELEERVRERSRATHPLEETARDALSALRQEEEPLETELAGTGTGGEAKAESSAVGLCSPARPLGQPASQPYTGETPFDVCWWYLFIHFELVLLTCDY